MGIKHACSRVKATIHELTQIREWLPRQLPPTFFAHVLIVLVPKNKCSHERFFFGCTVRSRVKHCPSPRYACSGWRVSRTRRHRHSQVRRHHLALLRRGSLLLPRQRRPPPPSSALTTSPSPRVEPDAQVFIVLFTGDENPPTGMP